MSNIKKNELVRKQFESMDRLSKLADEFNNNISDILTEHFGQSIRLINHEGDGWVYLFSYDRGNYRDNVGTIDGKLSGVDFFPVDEFLKEKDRGKILERLLAHTF